jgi:uncharacterized protein (DUF58 family)
MSPNRTTNLREGIREKKDGRRKNSVPPPLPKKERKPKREWKYLGPANMQGLTNLFFEAKKIVEGFYAGKHRSPFKGSSPEFSEYRQYNPGDEMRSIDWKVNARTDKYFVKQFEKETDMNTYILLDSSASMGFYKRSRRRSVNAPKLTGAGLTKLEYSCYITAALSYLLINQGDKVGLTFFDDSIRDHTHQGTTSRHLYAILDKLEHLSPGQSTSFSNVLRKTHGLYKRKGLLIVISDMLDEPEEIFKSLNMYVHGGFEIILFHVLHAQEYRLPAVGNARFVDSETGSDLTVVPADIEKGYNEEIDGFIETMSKMAKARGIDYNFVTTETPYHEILERYLLTRGRICQ